MGKPAPTPARRVARKDDVKISLKIDKVLDAACLAVIGKDKTMEVLRLADPALGSHVARFISTQSIACDVATNLNGLPSGRMVEVYGKEQVGKTTFIHGVMAQSQKANGVVAAWDSEEKWDLRYASGLGVDATRVLMLEPKVKKSLESAILATMKLVDHWQAHGLEKLYPLTVIWDSVAGMPTDEELENPDTNQPGVAARALRRACRILIQKMARAGVLFVVVNQEYEKIGGFSPTPGVKRSTYGGGGIRYHSTLRIELVRIGTLKDPKDSAVGIEGEVRVFKNSMGAPRSERYAIQNHVGFQNAWSIMEKLKSHGYMTFGGGWWNFSAKDIPPAKWQGGWLGLSDMLVANPVLYQTLAGIYVNLPPS